MACKQWDSPATTRPMSRDLDPQATATSGVTLISKETICGTQETGFTHTVCGEVAPASGEHVLLEERSDHRIYRSATGRSMMHATTHRPVRSPAVSILAPRRGARARGAGRPAGSRRSTATSSGGGGSSGDPDSDEPGEARPAPLAAAPKPKAKLTFGCLSLEERGE